MKQKFFRGQRVKFKPSLKKDGFSITPYSVAEAMKHEAIIEGSYSDLCHGKGFDTYSLLILAPQHRSSAWWHESILELIDDDRAKGEELIQLFHEEIYKDYAGENESREG